MADATTARADGCDLPTSADGCAGSAPAGKPDLRLAPTRVPAHYLPIEDSL
jgi:hypothetical protein